MGALFALLPSLLNTDISLSINNYSVVWQASSKKTIYVYRRGFEFVGLLTTSMKFWLIKPFGDFRFCEHNHVIIIFHNFTEFAINSRKSWGHDEKCSYAVALIDESNSRAHAALITKGGGGEGGSKKGQTPLSQRPRKPSDQRQVCKSCGRAHLDEDV